MGGCETGSPRDTLIDAIRLARSALQTPPPCREQAAPLRGDVAFEQIVEERSHVFRRGDSLPHCLIKKSVDFLNINVYECPTLGRPGRIPAARSLDPIEFKGSNALLEKRTKIVDDARGSREMNLKEVSKENALSRLRSKTDCPTLCGLGLYNSLLGVLIEKRNFYRKPGRFARRAFRRHAEIACARGV